MYFRLRISAVLTVGRQERGVCSGNWGAGGAGMEKEEKVLN